MYCKYGTFDFHPWEASISIDAQYLRNKQGFKEFQDLRFTFSGDIVGNDQFAINTRLNQMATAFSNDGRSCGLVHDNGTPTHHWMPNTADESSNITNVQVLQMELPETINGEFASGRHFKIKVGSLYKAHTDEILEWHDSLHRSSNAGPEWRWERWGKNRWVPRMVAINTLQTITHSGWAEGMSGWPATPAPLYSQPFEANHLRSVKHHSPNRHPGGYAIYRVEWTYTYVLPTFDDITAPTVIV